MSAPGEERNCDGEPGEQQAKSPDTSLQPLEVAQSSLALGESARIFVAG